MKYKKEPSSVMQVQCKYSIYSKTVCINSKLSLVLYNCDGAHFGLDFKFRTIFYVMYIRVNKVKRNQLIQRSFDSIHIYNRGSFSRACEIMYTKKKSVCAIFSLQSIQSFCVENYFGKKLLIRRY